MVIFLVFIFERDKTCLIQPLQFCSKENHGLLLKEELLNCPIYLSIYLYILSQPRKEDIRASAQRHHAKKKERIKSKIGKVKKLTVMLQKRLKIVKNKCRGSGHEMWDCPYRWPKKSIGLRGQGYDGEVDCTQRWPTERMNICCNWL